MDGWPQRLCRFCSLGLLLGGLAIALQFRKATTREALATVSRPISTSFPAARNSTAQPTPSPTRLLECMARRLALMHDVAKWKWNHGQAVHDPAREATLLGACLESARGLGLEEGEVTTFLTAQFAAARQAQSAAFERWQLAGRPTFADVPDLTTVTRPRIETLTREMLVELQGWTVRGGPVADDKLAREMAAMAAAHDLDPAAWAMATAPVAPPSRPGRPRYGL